jgi:predicted AAA+ superfamily ATPase
LLDRLTSVNPWWLDRTAIAQDSQILRWTQAPLRWTPQVVSDLDLTVPAVYTLRGPRQVGKTTASKLMIQRSLREVPQEEVLFYSCDLDKDPDVIREIVQAARRLRPQAKRWRIFLDEVTSIPNWQVGVKWLRDNTLAANDTFVVTGSSSIDLAAGAERMPGRRGSVERPDRILLPLSFADYARLHGLTPPAVLRLPEFFEPRARDVLTQASLRLADLRALLDRYLHVGGFPTAVTAEAATGSVSDAVLRDLWLLIEGELGRRGRDPLRAYRTLEHAVRTMGQRTHWTALGEALGTNYHTAEDYATLMARAFALLILYRYELHRGGPQLRAEKKLYVVDPLLAYIPRRVRQVGLHPEEPKLVENAVAIALFRSDEQPLIEQFALPQGLFYWRSQSGGEVDFLAGHGAIADRIPVEVKYQTTVTGRDLAAMRRSFARGLLITVDALDLEHPPFLQIPAALFLWVLGGEHVTPAT